MSPFNKLATGESKYKLLNSLMKKHRQFPSHIFSLIHNDLDGLNQWDKTHQTIGLVASKEALATAKETYPQSKFYAQSLTSFRIAQHVSLCYVLDQQCNALSTLAQREKLFSKAAEQIMPYGLFVCDWMSGTHFEALIHSSSSQEITEQQVSFSSWKNKKNSYKQQLLTFTRTKDDLYTRQETAITYFAPTLEQIKVLAKKYFGSHSFLDYRGNKSKKKNNQHYVLVAQKD